MLLGLLALGSPVLALAGPAAPATAHGSTERPASRVYACRFEQPDNPMCAQAWSANAQALYDWMEVNIGDAAGRHQDLIPDGQLCSAGRAKYAAFDRPGPWPVTELRTDGSGLVDLVYQNTAPHATEYYRVYLTRAGFDAGADPLAWGDLELVHDSGRLDRSPSQRLRVALPAREVPAILYVVWQRSDSPEAFYACSDVTIDAGSGGPSTTAPTTTAPSTSTTARSTTTPPTTVGSTTTLPTTTAPTTAPPTTGAPTSPAPTATSTSTDRSSATSDPAPSPSTPDPNPSTVDPASAPREDGGQAMASAATGSPPSTTPATAPLSSVTGGEGAVAPGSGPSTAAARPGADGSTSPDPLAAGAADQRAASASASTGRGSTMLAVGGLGSAAAILLGVGLRWAAGHRRPFATMPGPAGDGSRPGPRPHLRPDRLQRWVS